MSISIDNSKCQFTDLSPLEELVNKEDTRSFLYTSSGFSALSVALEVLDVKRAVLPSFCWAGTFQSVKLQGVECLIADVDPQTGCLSVPCVERFDLDFFDCVVASCPLSTVPNLRPLHDFCKSFGKTLIIESFESYGTKGVCNLGDAVCYSFHSYSAFPLGNLGALVVDSSLYPQALEFATTLNVRPTVNVDLDLLAIEYELEARIRNSELYLEKVGHLVPLSSVRPTVYSCIPLFLSSKYFATQIKFIFEQEGIETRRGYKPLVSRTVAEDLYSRSICLPVHSSVSESDIDKIVWAMTRV